MTVRRSHDEHVALYCEFARRVAGLSPESLDRLTVRCAAIDGDSFAALLGRARLAAQPHEVFHAFTNRGSTALNVIANVARGVQTGLAVAHELAGEFQTLGDDTPPARRTESTDNPRAAKYVDAFLAIESTAGPLGRNHPGVAVALRAASQAVMRHDWLDPENFDRIYAFIEPEIPFAQLNVASHAV